MVHGPHLCPVFLSKPVRYYSNTARDRTRIMNENRGRAVVYQWVNLITGELYVGSGIDGATRLGSYWTPSMLGRNRRVYNNIRAYAHHNFALAILEDLGPTSQVSNDALL